MTVERTDERLELRSSPGEWWWGGAVADGQAMPFGTAPHRRDLSTSAGTIDDETAGANQSAPLLVSSAGRYVWSEEPFAFAFDGSGGLTVDGRDLVCGQGEATLAGAFRAAATEHFPAAGRAPASAMFSAPQYNTWIEMPYQPTQDKVLTYIRDLLDAGFPPGLVMIDDQWSVDYGTWRFDRARFPDPAAMTKTLHDWGCTLMLWVVPFVSPDSETFRFLEEQGWLIRRPDGNPAIRRWWNGYSALLDLGNPHATQWLHSELGALMSEHGVDGFKFDGGDLRDHRDDDVSGAPGAVAQCEAWAKLGAHYPFNEFRACWKMGGQPLGQRLHDKPPTWGYGGLGSLIPEGIAQGLIGHPYICPDMIGGGELGALVEGTVDQELFVRYTQCAALFPMMQFSHVSVAGARRRAPEGRTRCRRPSPAAGPEILTLVERSARTGDPILRPLAYAHPGYESVHDQFLLGDDLFCAPVLEQGATSRRVLIPPGRWQDLAGQVVEGPAEITVRDRSDVDPRVATRAIAPYSSCDASRAAQGLDGDAPHGLGAQPRVRAHGDAPRCRYPVRRLAGTATRGHPWLRRRSELRGVPGRLQRGCDRPRRLVVHLRSRPLPRRLRGCSHRAEKSARERPPGAGRRRRRSRTARVSDQDRQPLRPLNVIVATKCFWAMTKAMISGIVATTLPAMSSDHWVRRVPWKFARPSWIV